MFGISCAPEIYQKILQQVLQECKGVNNILDDIIVHSDTDGEHNKTFEEIV